MDRKIRVKFGDIGSISVERNEQGGTVTASMLQPKIRAMVGTNSITTPEIQASADDLGGLLVMLETAQFVQTVIGNVNPEIEIDPATLESEIQDYVDELRTKYRRVRVGRLSFLPPAADRSEQPAEPANPIKPFPQFSGEWRFMDSILVAKAEAVEYFGRCETLDQIGGLSAYVRGAIQSMDGEISRARADGIDRVLENEAGVDRLIVGQFVAATAGYVSGEVTLSCGHKRCIPVSSRSIGSETMMKCPECASRGCFVDDPGKIGGLADGK